MAMSRRQQVIEALKARVAAITIAGGFNTDAGSLVFLNETPALGPDDPDVAIAMLIRDDDPSYHGEQVFYRLPIEFQALAKADLAAPWVIVEQVLQDIKRAVELADRTLGRLLRTNLERRSTRTLEREQGSTAVGVAITYEAPIAETWGTP
jgi:hypothetical protein